MNRIAVRSPYGEEVVGEVTVSTETEAEAALALAYEIFETGQRLPKEERLSILERLAELVERDREKLAVLATREGGKPISDSRVEIERAILGIKMAAAYLRVQAGREIPMDLSAATRGRRAHTRLEPRGVVLAISAFNHPFNLCIHQVIPAVAVGCPVLIKPSSTTPLSCQALMQLLREAGLPPGYAEMLVLTRENTERLVRDQRLGFFSFIGSAEVGNRLRNTLAPGVTCCLEHGGSAPLIIDEVLDDELAVKAILKGGYYHAGQVCVSVQRVFVPKAKGKSFARALAGEVEKLRVGDPMQDDTEVGPLISKAELERVGAWVLEAAACGTEILAGGRALAGNCFAPTLLYEPPVSTNVSTKEVFGPVVSIYEYSSIEEAITRANQLPFLFQASLFSQRIDVALRVSAELRATTVLINDHTAFRADWMPFGGQRESGQGLGGIADAMRDMQFEKLVVYREAGR